MFFLMVSNRKKISEECAFRINIVLIGAYLYINIYTKFSIIIIIISRKTFKRTKNV